MNELPETLYVTNTNSSVTGPTTVHTSEDCPQLGERIRSVAREMYPPAHRQPCSICIGGVAGYGNAERQPSTKLATRLSRADPDDVGGDA